MESFGKQFSEELIVISEQEKQLFSFNQPHGTIYTYYYKHYYGNSITIHVHTLLR